MIEKDSQQPHPGVCAAIIEQSCLLPVVLFFFFIKLMSHTS